jgi:hypothetical protein
MDNPTVLSNEHPMVGRSGEIRSVFFLLMQRKADLGCRTGRVSAFCHTYDRESL